MSGVESDPGLTKEFIDHLTNLDVSEPDVVEACALKFQILSQGLRVSAEIMAVLALDDPSAPTRPRRTRSGVSGGLDLLLAPNVFVNAPVLETYASASVLNLAFRGDILTVSDGATDWPVSLVPPPRYYGQVASDGKTALDRVAQMCSPDRLCFGITGPGCSFWPRADRCRYCSIGFNYSQDASRKNEALLLEVLAKAKADTARPARHLLLGGGTPPGPDMGARICANLIRRVKEVSAISIYVMIAAPLDDSYIDLLVDAGVDELGMNLEFWDPISWETYIPGKLRRIGRQRYLDALQYSAHKLGPVKTRSIIIAGLEPFEQTLQAVERLSSWGVLPIISPFRPLDGTDLAATRGPEGREYQNLFVEASRIAQAHGMKLGPLCFPCQNNVLALPF